MHLVARSFSFLKQTLFFLFLFSSFSSVLAQEKQWTWMGGDKAPAKPGIYGVKNISDPDNIPGGRSSAVQWTDASGNLWLMGGSGNASTGSGNLNDLWMYSPAAHEWTWVSGDMIANQAGVYGTKGQSHPDNKPGARSTSTSFSDASGNLWLFGGYSGAGYLSDLWMYAPVANEWTWVSGDNTNNRPGVYGAKGTPHLTNKPGGRYSSASCVDANGDVWLFGGYGYGATGSDLYLNDLWKFTPSTSEWTWVSGDNVTGQVGAYGTKGAPAAGNKPGARYSSAMWTDASGNIWLFGGTGLAVTTSFGELNDLWKYNPSAGEWTWVSGDSAINVLGIYGTLGTSAGTNKPGGRHAPAMWKDMNGGIYLFGGSGYPINAVFGYLNDLWKLDPVSAEWTWIGGSNTGSQRGAYGVIETPAAGNIPGARLSASNWIDASGKLWLFGGSGYGATTPGNLNDLWNYTLPNITLPVVFHNFTAQKLTAKIQLNWSTTREENSHHFTIERSSDGIVFENIGKVGASENSSSVINYHFTDFAPLQGANLYRLKQVDIDGGFQYSKIVRVLMEAPGFGFTLLQNPVQNNLSLQLQLAAAQKLKLGIKDARGNLLMSKEHFFSKGSSVYSLPVNYLPKGVYYLTIQAGGAGNTKTFIKL